MFYGERGNYRQVSDSKKFYKLISELAEVDEKLRKELKKHPEILKLYEKTIETLELMHSETVDANYREGFSFGLLIGIDAMQGFNDY